MNTRAKLQLVDVDYANPRHAADLVELLNSYAVDPAGGGKGLSDFARQNLPRSLAARPQAFSVMAYDGGDAIGLVNCIEGFSTFACRPLVNVHDVVVLESHRGLGVAGLMLQRIETLARQRDACKLTLEVLQGNHAAMRLYQRLGFAGFQLDPVMGQASFMQKWLD